MTDPFSILVGAASIAALSGKAINAASTFHGSYRHAEQQIKHAQAQLDFLRYYLERTESDSNSQDLSREAYLSMVRSSLDAISGGFPTGLDSETKKGRFRWAAKQKQRVVDAQDNLGEMQISDIWCRQQDILREIAEIRIVLARMERSLSIQSQQKQQEQLNRRNELYSFSTPTQLGNKKLVATVQQLNVRIGDYLGFKGSLTTFIVKDILKYCVIWRIPVLGSTLLRGQLSIWSNFWFCPYISPSIKIQRVVDEEMPILDACRRGDISVIRGLLQTRKAHPNDTTSDNLTLLYLVIKEGITEAVSLLLEFGADPSLTYGRLETSPLCTAFYMGNLEIAHLLIQAGASLEHVTHCTWMCPRYLFDPHAPSKHTVELLDLCHTSGFEEWDMPDVLGWTIMHRAAAYGQARDIRKLLNLKTQWNLLTFKLHWLPIFCAVKYGNVATFEVFASLIMPMELRGLRDVRGWSLLHVAAESGEEGLIARLLNLGCDPSQISDKSKLGVPIGLEFLEVTPADIANACGHHDVYQGVLAESIGESVHRSL
ncbi:hypothetical protein IFR05_014864 [Cadophora sp. M221]|nr:hypothetical protein IFR05_014864 [Cadophora sp. M221]